ncbi:ABC transporter ATP-binding protein [Halosimplex pelagicum]|uniref:ABC transporter ATP-binding protein n=1 Tax=Halosimplex pelagicum TaxID=869886 RepID=A0A7D5P7K8_9EURY|nr:ABC transporter ATP-binding protein [Halosimplex pelagicum]QLH81201.1 ABC transporter ATP-binding protein [Halosimplex pelagicum]
MSDEISLDKKLRALARVARFRPLFTAGIIGLSTFAALLEGIGLSFLYPIIQLARGGVDGGGQYLELFVRVFEIAGVPFTLESVVVGVAIVMTVRYTSSFLVDWLKAALRTNYVRHLQVESFDHALDAEVAYFDEEGSDDILNAIVTQASYAGRTIDRVVKIIEQGFLTAMYGLVALVMAPRLTAATVVILGVFVVISRTVLESGYSVGDRVAEANEAVQMAAQAGTQGIRDVKLFGMKAELFDRFQGATGQRVTAKVKLRRNEAMLDNFYQLATAIIVFVLIYVALRIANLSLASLSVFLFAMFRLAPRASTLNNYLYQLESDLPHLVRTQEFIDELDDRREPTVSEIRVPDPVETIAFDDVSFDYNSGKRVFDGLSFSVDRGEFVAFVGPSGAGKSTIVSLLTRMYEPDGGRILADGSPITEMDLAAWRERVSVVRQHPYIFNDTLRANVTIADRQATHSDVKRVCEIAQVTEFLDDLPNGYETELGDNGVRLSGGQKQRVALARALLKDADFLVLDEATSDLDSNIEETVHDAIEAMDRDYAMLVIAHRLSTVVNADRIYAVEDGGISETGSHAELVKQDGTYADLYATQAQSG